MSWLKNLVGGKRMAALTAGTKAPQFELPSMDGSKFSLNEALTRGPVLAVFFKVSCPVCQYAFPYFQRVYKAYGNSKLTVVWISEDGVIEISSVGWVRSEFDEICQKAAFAAGNIPKPVFQPAEKVADFR